jgi:hypothetical protein
VPWSVNAPWGAGGTFDINGVSDFRVYVGDTTINADAAGNASSVTGWFNMAATGTSGMGGPTSVAVTLGLPALKVAPNTPTNLVATRISDTQTKLTWNQTNASNGAPTSVLVQSSVNGGAFTDLVTLSPTTSATVATAPNRKTVYRVRSANSAGTTAFVTSGPVYTTPGAPTNAVATKGTAQDITVSFTENVDYAEHTHEVWHGVVAGGVTTWDAAAATTLASGVTSWVDSAPDPSDVHVYRVRAVTGSLPSDYAVTNSVQLLAPPNKPTVNLIPPYVDIATPVTLSWVHNPVDTTPQTALQLVIKVNGVTELDTGKIAITASSTPMDLSAYAVNDVVSVQLRTWGSATTGGSDGTGGSPWSDLVTFRLKTLPVATITEPTDGSTLNDATLRVTTGFSQAEGATFVKEELQLLQGTDVLETMSSTISVGVTINTLVQNGESYTIQARVQDSNGLWSNWASNDFSVEYLAPVPAGIQVTFLPDTGFGQIDLTIPAPVAGQSEASTVAITRNISGVEEIIVSNYPVPSDDYALTFLDTTPVVNGTNTYTVTTTSDLGAQSTSTADLVTSECRRAYLSKGSGFASVVVFGGNLSVKETLGVASDTVEAAGRIKPIGLYGTETSVQLKVESFVYTGFGSSMDQLRALLLAPGQACYRDASGRRVFGAVKGGVSYKKADRGDLSFTLTEAD